MAARKATSSRGPDGGPPITPVAELPREPAMPPNTAPAVPTPGRIVLYALSEQDAAVVNARRVKAARLRVDRSGARGHLGNEVREGDEFPMVVVRVWPDSVNGQVLLDGDDTLWATSRHEGTEPGTWHWPART